MTQTFALILQYKYAVLFPLSIIEGPILAVIGGFLASLSIFNALIVYAIVVVGDIVGDGVLYFIGRFGGGHFLRRFGKFFKITEEKAAAAKELFAAHHKKSLVLSKILHGIGISGLIAAGSLKIPYPKYFLTCLSVSVLQSAVLVAVGFFFGSAYIQIGKYLDYYAVAAFIVAVIIATIVVIKLRARSKSNR